MRAWKAAMMAGLLVMAAGCAAARPQAGLREAVPADDSLPCARTGVGRATHYAPALLFDRRPGCYQAGQFAYRSDWPSTDAFYAPGQVIFYRERFYDYQGPGFENQDFTYRRFDTYRTGVGYR